MGNKGYSTIPRTLLDSITFLVRALPIRSVPTFIELLVGAMITPSRVRHKALAGNQAAAQLDRLLQVAPAGQVVVGRTGRATGQTGDKLLSATGLVPDL